MSLYILEELDERQYKLFFTDHGIKPNQRTIHFAVDPEKWQKPSHSDYYDYPKPRCGARHASFGTRDIKKVNCLRCRTILRPWL